MAGNLLQQPALCCTFGQELQLSIRMLESPLQELRKFLYEHADSNPMLELDESGKSSGEMFSTLPLETDISAAGKAFSEHLLLQLGMLEMEPDVRALCQYIVACLDSRGWLDVTLQDISADTGAEPFDVTQALYAVQSLSPAGVGARDMTECLILQLMKSEYFNAYTIRLAKEGLPLLAENKMREIANLLHVDIEKARRVSDVICGLNPVPSSGFGSGDRVRYIVPDAAVMNDGIRAAVYLNDTLAPRPRVSEDYCYMMEHGCFEKERNQIRRGKQLAQKIVSCYEKRQATLRSVIEAIVALQPEYFRMGAALRPMRLRDVAERLGMHISTVSRAVSDKYILCKAGTVSLHSLFSTVVPDRYGGQVSVFLIKQRIKTYIAAEDPRKPLSDEVLKQTLAAGGVSISRRAIANYRDSLGIPTSFDRRR